MNTAASPGLVGAWRRRVRRRAAARRTAASSAAIRPLGAASAVPSASPSSDPPATSARHTASAATGTIGPPGIVKGAGPRFLTTMQIPVLAGREIDDRDQPGSTPVAVISERLARSYFANENPVGRRISFSDDKRDFEIVGVSANLRSGGLKNEGGNPMTVFVAVSQSSPDRVTYALRGTHVRLDVLSPHECYSGTESDTNNGALVIRLSRGGDVVLLARHFVGHYSRKLGKRVRGKALATIEATMPLCETWRNPRTPPRPATKAPKGSIGRRTATSAHRQSTSRASP